MRQTVTKHGPTCASGGWAQTYTKTLNMNNTKCQGAWVGQNLFKQWTKNAPGEGRRQNKKEPKLIQHVARGVAGPNVHKKSGGGGGQNLIKKCSKNAPGAGCLKCASGRGCSKNAPKISQTQPKMSQTCTQHVLNWSKMRTCPRRSRTHAHAHSPTRPRTARHGPAPVPHAHPRASPARPRTLRPTRTFQHACVLMRSPNTPEQAEHRQQQDAYKL